LDRRGRSRFRFRCQASNQFAPSPSPRIGRRLWSSDRADRKSVAGRGFRSVRVGSGLRTRASVRTIIGVELFCGVGGMTLGFEQAGVRVAGAFDKDKINVEYHALNFPASLTIEADLSDLTGPKLLAACSLKAGGIDVLFGGPPCQGFSEIGRRDDDDHRNLLILDFARLIRTLRPNYFVVENVRGLLYGYSKPILDKFLTLVVQAGYDYVKPIKLLDASQHGVPQKRRRAFVLGFKKGLVPPTYPDPILVGNNDPVLSPTVVDAIGDLPEVSDYAHLLTSDIFEGDAGKPSTYAAVLRRGRDGHLPRGKHRITGCLRTVHSKATMDRFMRTLPGTYELKSRCFRLKDDGLAYTLRAGSDVQHGSFTAARPIHPTQPRCITTREAARLHSFPDWFEFHPTKWHGFRQVGNSVPPLLARAVATEIVKACEMSGLLDRPPTD
jgi:DNA (cytosine-5)-methyltransferase 1